MPELTESEYEELWRLRSVEDDLAAALAREAEWQNSAEGLQVDLERAQETIERLEFAEKSALDGRKRAQENLRNANEKVHQLTAQVASLVSDLDHASRQLRIREDVWLPRSTTPLPGGWILDPSLPHGSVYTFGDFPTPHIRMRTAVTVDAVENPCGDMLLNDYNFIDVGVLAPSKPLSPQDLYDAIAQMNGHAQAPPVRRAIHETPPGIEPPVTIHFQRRVRRN